MRLVFERSIPCAPEVAFGLVTDPDAMNAWSTARIQAGSPGDGGHPAGVGALRIVELPRRAGRLEEVVVACEPPRRFVYRVLRGAPVRHHQGTLDLAPEGEGTRLRWTVDLEFPVHGLGHVARWMLRPELERSLDALARLAPGASPRPLPTHGCVSDADTLSRLYAEAEAIRDVQRARADAYRSADDPRYGFTRVYEHVTDLQIAGCRAGRFHHPGWVLRLIPPFHRYYEEALDAFDRGGPCETHWAHAFAVTRRDRWHLGRFHTAVRAILLGMRAHIEDDLPRTLAGVWLAHYRGRCDYVRFRGDYLTMGPIFRAAGDRLLSEFSFRELPLRQQMIDVVVPAELKDWWTARSFYDIPKRRRQAFERGERLARFVASHAGEDRRALAASS